MQLVYGRTFLPINSAQTTSRVRQILADSGRPLRYEAFIDVLVYLDGTDQADLTAKENAFNAALLVPYQNLVLFQDSGQPTGTKLLEAPSITGVRIIDGPNYTNDARDGEYVTQRTCRFTAHAEYVIRGSEAACLAWTESVSILGTGGPRRRWRELLNGPPIRQQTSPATTVRAFQTGHAVGHMIRPGAPPPLFPAYEHLDRRRITPISPRRLGDLFVEPGINWSYEFEANVPLVGLPNLPPF